MQKTTRQGVAKGGAAFRNTSHATTVVAPSYPLLRITLIAMVNLTASYSTLTWIPAWLDKGTNTTKGTEATLPSLSWTLVTLFIFQTVVGLVQAHLLSSSTATAAAISTTGAMKSTATSRSAQSPSLLNVINTSIAIGAVGTLICHIFAVLFGAGTVHQAKETSQLACYLSLLTFYPASFVLGTDLKSWLRVFIHNSPETYTEAAHYCQGMMAIFGAWLGSIVIPLDWDRSWQAWPVPCILGAFLFYCIGTVVGFVVSLVMRQRKAREEFGIKANTKKGEKAAIDS